VKRITYRFDRGAGLVLLLAILDQQGREPNHRAGRLINKLPGLRVLTGELDLPQARIADVPRIKRAGLVSPLAV
jgi:hypothetical protein